MDVGNAQLFLLAGMLIALVLAFRDAVLSVLSHPIRIEIKHHHTLDMDDNWLAAMAMQEADDDDEIEIDPDDDDDAEPFTGMRPYETN